ncbi:D-isomer specific 2-hydroxyacid dehydrogenase family protein [Enterococcus sp. DIV0802b]|uniref:D-isomer specific 2-hydroxyacid dehydrogenase family protein n=1 Tax=Enterococcus sp. DIV0802b TaxID=2774704 RepID=UPI003D2FA36D
MKKTAIVNANSFGKYFPEYMDQLNKQVGETKRFKFPSDISPEDLAAELKGFSFIIIGTEPRLPKSFFEKMPKLQLVVRFGIGYDNVDVIAAKENKVMVSNIPAYMERDDVAEYAVSLILTAAKLVTYTAEKVKEGEWSKDRGRYLGHRLNKKTIGICGFGNIGTRVAEIMQAFNCKIICYDPYLSVEEVEKRGGEKVDFDELLAQADIISLHMNCTAENKGLFNKSAFKKMKASAVLVNTARGALVNEEDLVLALTAGKFGSYATDVLENEPPTADHPFMNQEKIVLTPHIGAYNHECNEMMCESVVDDIARVNAGGEPKHLLEG